MSSVRRGAPTALRPSALAGAAFAAPALALALAAGGAAAQTGLGALNPSGVTPVAGTIASATVSSSFRPLANRIFHVQQSGAAVISCTLERQLDGSTWVPITVTAGGSTTSMYNWTYTGSALSEDVVEPQANVLYRLDCGGGANGSYTSGTLAYRFSQ